MKSSRVPNQTPITLRSLLQRRKTNLEDWVANNGIFTYELLCERCSRIGVVPPTLEEFQEVLPKGEITSPTEGVVVLPPPPVVAESTGEIVEDQPVVDQETPEPVVGPVDSLSHRKEKRRR